MRVSLFDNHQNYGLGGSQKIAFKYAISKEYDYLIILHGDDQASTSDIPLLLSEAIRKETHILGSRFQRGAKREGYQKTRVIGNMALNVIFSLVLLKKISDLGSGLNIFSVKALKKIDLDNLTDYFNFNVELLLTFDRLGIPFLYHPIKWRETDQVSNAKNISVALSMLKSLLAMKVPFLENKKPRPLEFYQYDEY